MYKPFVGRTLSQVLDNICKSHSDNNKRVLLAFVHLDPPEEEIFMSKRGLKKLFDFRAFVDDASWSLWEFLTPHI
jgi:hypothetical protein